MIRNVAELTIENIETKEKTTYSNLSYEMLENMYYKLNIDSLKETTFKVFRDFEEKGNRIYFAYPMQTISELNCLPKEKDELITDLDDVAEVKYRIDVAYLKKIAKDKIKYSIRVYPMDI